MFCSRAHQQGRCLLSRRLKPRRSSFLLQLPPLRYACPVCVLQYTRLSFKPVPTSPSSFTRPRWRHFHIDGSARSVGPCNHRAAAGRDKNRVYFPPKHFSVKKQPRNQREDREDCQIEPCGAHCYPADEWVLIGSCKGQNTADTSQWIAEAIVCLHPLLLPLKLLVFSFTGAKSDPGIDLSSSKSFIDTKIIQ